MIQVKNIQKRYHDVRAGMVTISPVVAISNFLLIAYNFSVIKDIISFEIFTVFFIISSIFCFMLIGSIFRKKQYKVDNTIQYENNPEIHKTMLAILEALPPSVHIFERIEYHKKHLS